MKKAVVLGVILISAYAVGAWALWPFDKTTENTQESVKGNRHSQSFYAVKDEMLDKVYYDHRKTLYCNADFTAHKKIIKPDGFKIPNLRQVDFKVYDISPEDLQRKAERMEWEHIVPAQNFGKMFPEWSKGHKNCVSGKGKAFKGRGCAEQESEDFRYMYTDMYNLYPSIGVVNYLRANFSFTQFDARQKNTFGRCNMKISRNKAEPADQVKGMIARTYLYMQKTYPRYSIGEPAYSVLKAWNKKYPVSKWECVRTFRIEKVQGNANMLVKKPCLERGWYQDNWR